MLERFIKDVAVLFATIDPIGSVLVFVALTHHLSASERRRVARRSVIIAGAILLGFMILGQILLNAMHISLHSFQIAGAIFLFFFGAQLTFGHDPHASLSPEPGHDISVFPIALPAIASPGALAAAVVLTNNDVYSIPMQALTVVALVIILGITYVMLFYASFIYRILGNSGAAVIIRVLGLILASLAVEMLAEAIKATYSIPHGIP
ncbi:MAG: MarC family protein [Acidobacteriota bacterium]|nr:MarC family protein [Acidobacteriota bacterium]